MKKQDGFGAIGVVVVIVALLAIGGAGYAVYRHQSSDSKESAGSTTTSSGQTSDEGSLAISEWGVNLKNAVAEKLTYAYNGASGKDVYNGDSYESIAILGFKQDALQNIGCDASTSILRSKVQPKVTDVVKLGDYYYWSYGEPQNCNEGSDVQLAQDFTASFDLSKLELQP